MARKLDLRTGRTVWQANRAPSVPTQKLSRDIKTEVLVVGMGVSGAMIAEQLTADGRDVAMIDRRGPLLGSTLATTALVQFEIDQPLTKLMTQIGRPDAERAWRRSRLAVSNLVERIEELGISCDAVRRNSLYLAGNSLGAADLRTEADARRAAGIGAEYLARGALQARYGIKRDAAILSHGNVALDPRKLVAGLLNLAAQRKARLYAPVEAITMRHAKDEVVVETASGPTIRAKHVVLATGYELMDGIDAPRHQIISTWAIATAPQKRALWPEHCHIWEASDPYLYMRTTSDGRVVAGGEDEDCTDEDRRDGLIGKKTHASWQSSSPA
jgi:glycine/D-amino acid oxidase-like deaminating enzyme